jgi:hypothetical protein
MVARPRGVGGAIAEPVQLRMPAAVVPQQLSTRGQNRQVVPHDWYFEVLATCGKKSFFVLAMDLQGLKPS